ncbi:hypothetical protein [Alloalcanivorax xenomutans]|uniref:hypothetical protein n=1 Tax=Alloalcanivorax xenomutans TaxID=1094342 RepID=UPI003BAAD3D3
MPTIQPRFPLGATVITPGAAAAFADTNVHPAHYLQRHRHGDWARCRQKTRHQMKKHSPRDTD